MKKTLSVLIGIAVCLLSSCEFMAKPSFTVTVVNKATTEETITESTYMFDINTLVGINGAEDTMVRKLHPENQPAHPKYGTNTSHTTEITSSMNKKDIDSNGGNKLYFAWDTHRENVWNRISSTPAVFLNQSIHLVEVTGFSGSDIVITLEGKYNSYWNDNDKDEATRTNVIDGVKGITVKVTVDGKEVPAENIKVTTRKLYTK